jgi:immunoglobulin-like protein involved in spore germination
MNLKTLTTIIVLLVLAAVVIFVVPKIKQDESGQVTDFHSCEAYGYPVELSNPAICRTPDGRVFVHNDPQPDPEVVVETPQPGDLVTSPLKVKGKARGGWFFEANIPVTLKDQNGKILAQKGFQALGDWMTSDYVEFADNLIFTTPTTEFGVLIIEKDNPSGDPDHDASFAVPVRFR